MERDKVIKLSVAAVIGAIAVVLLAVQLFGGRRPKVNPIDLESVAQPEPGQELGGARTAPGG